MNSRSDRLSEPVRSHLRTDFAKLREEMTAQQALDAIRGQNPGEAIIYFYVTDDAGRLTGVVPTRRLLTTPLEHTLADIMDCRVATINHNATVLDACEFFVLYKLLAFPVIDDERKLLGTIDVKVFTEQVFELAETDEDAGDVFAVIGFHMSQVRAASPFKAFRLRFPWLLATVASGVLCAALAGAFETTLARSVVLAFFLALVLGLGESVCIQSVALTIQSLHAAKPTWRWYIGAFRREIAVALLLGTAIGGLVSLLVWLWQGLGMGGLVVGSTIAFSLCSSSVIGLSIPAVLRARKLDPKVAAGPIALALSDVFSLLFYFTLAKLLLT